MDIDTFDGQADLARVQESEGGDLSTKLGIILRKNRGINLYLLCDSFDIDILGDNGGILATPKATVRYLKIQCPSPKYLQF
jgi:hypothetical protein